MPLTHLPEILYIRHGQTDWNVERRYQGRKDIPLNPVGEAQADANGRFLRAIFDNTGNDPMQWNWLASPLGRARDTAQRVRKAFTCCLPDLAFDERLEEMAYGEWEGLRLSEIGRDRMPPHGERDPEFWYFRPPGGESFDDLAERVRAVIASISGPTVMIAHGGVVRVLRHLIEDTPRGDVVNWPVPQDGIMRFSNGQMDVLPNPELAAQTIA